MTFVITFLNAKTLYEKGTVATVENPFIDRLHSSWLWLILPFTCAGIYLLFVYFRNTRNQTTENTNIS
jgi:ABC-type dipeptide/oligopeptide/nickel transport system permease component